MWLSADHSVILWSCSSNGKVGSLGACPGRNTVEKQKARKCFIYADFRCFMKTQKCVEFKFDHSLSHFYAKRSKIEYISGCGADGSARHLGVLPTTSIKKFQTLKEALNTADFRLVGFLKKPPKVATTT